MIEVHVSVKEDWSGDLLLESLPPDDPRASGLLSAKIGDVGFLEHAERDETPRHRIALVSLGQA